MNIASKELIDKSAMANDKPTPLGNIRILEGQIDNLLTKKKELEKQMESYDSKEINLKNVEEFEKIEKEWEFLNGYHNTLRDQLVVIMNENNVVIPPTKNLLQ
jgi:predicted  nucleic acid-binding Zn-ribbon protein